MYRGFKLKLNSWNSPKLFEVGNKLFDSSKIEISSVLDRLVSANGSIDGSRLQEDWFPMVNSNIFISHSHDDKQTAITLAGWLKDKFDLDSFVDSCIWGHSDALLKLLGKECRSDNKETYDYNKLCYAASHVHMMLSTSLSMMIDKSECLIFLNSPHSITSKGIVSKTNSPWIYFEISTSKYIRKKNPQQHRRRMLHEKIAASFKDIEIKYSLDLDHLVELNGTSLKAWKGGHNKQTHPLDTLYNQNPV